VDTRERILEAALKLFSKKGFLGATTKEIAREAGFSEVTLFRYFQSKENLFITVLEHYSFLPKLKELSKDLEEKEIDEALKALAKAFLERLRSKKALISIMHSELSRYPEIIQKAYQRIIEGVFEELSQYFKNLKEKGLLKEDFSPTLLSQAFLGLFFSYFHARELKGLNFKEVDEEEVIEKYVKIFLEGIKNY